jgi:hypothetical protein
MMVAEDVTITEEAQVSLEAEEVQLQEEKEALLQDEGSGGDLKLVQHQEKVVLDQEAHQLQEEKVVLHQTDQEQKVHLIEHQDVQKICDTKTKKTKKRLTFS